MHRLAAVLAILLLSLAAAPLARAQIGPNVPEPLTQDPPPPPAAPQKFDDGGFSTLQQVLIFGSAALVLGVIAFVIVRDARRAAPVDERAGGSRSGSGSGSARDAGKGSAKSARERERAQRAKRQKAKAARQQRRHNRPR
jgi:hypothetical protein